MIEIIRRRTAERIATVDLDSLVGAILAGVRWHNADLTGFDLTDAELSGASLDGSLFAGARLRWTRLRRASLIEADLTGAEMCGCDLCGAVLTGADLSSLDLTATVYDKDTRFPEGFDPWGRGMPQRVYWDDE